MNDIYIAFITFLKLFITFIEITIYLDNANIFLRILAIILFGISFHSLHILLEALSQS